MRRAHVFRVFRSWLKKWDFELITTIKVGRGLRSLTIPHGEAAGDVYEIREIE